MVNTESQCGLIRTRDAGGNVIIGRRGGNSAITGPIRKRHYCRQLPSGISPNAEDLKWCERGLTNRCRRSPASSRRVDNAPPRIPNIWVRHVRAYRAANPSLNYSEAMAQARASYTPIVKKNSRNVSQKKEVHTSHSHSRTPREGGNDFKSQVGAGGVLSMDPISMVVGTSELDATMTEDLVKANDIAWRNNATVVRMGPLRSRYKRRPHRFGEKVPAKMGRPSARNAVREAHAYGRLNRAGISPRPIWIGAGAIVVPGVARTLDTTIRVQRGRLTSSQQSALVKICTAPDNYLHPSHARYIGYVVVEPTLAGKHGVPELVFIHPTGVSVFPTRVCHAGVAKNALLSIRDLLVPGTTDVLDEAIEKIARTGTTSALGLKTTVA